MKRNRKVKIMGLAAGLVLALAACGGTNTQEEQEYREQGMNLLQEGNYEEAVNAFQKSLDQCKGGITDLELDTCYYKAEAQYLSGDYEGAQKTYTAIIDYNQDAKAYLLRGGLYYKTGVEEQEGQGAKDLKRAIEEEKENYEIYIGVYEILMGAGDPKENAKNYLEQALVLPCESAREQMYQGYVYHLLEDEENAKALLEKAAEAGEKKAYYYLTEIYETLGESVASENAFAAYLDSGLSSGADLYQIGQKMIQLDKQVRAAECFRKAMEIGDAQTKQLSQKSLIVTYENMGDFDAAKKEMQEYAVTYPEDTSMKKEQIFLETRGLEETEETQETETQGTETQEGTEDISE